MNPITRKYLVIHTAWIALAALLAAACPHSPQTWAGPPKLPTGELQNYDVYWTETDANGLPLNPTWGPNQADAKALPPTGPQKAACYNAPQSCTSQTTLVDWAPPISVCRFGVDAHLAGPFPAHVNWTVATYTGLATMPAIPSGLLVPISDDEDFNVVLIAAEANGRLSNRGLTFYNEAVSFSPSINGESSHKYIELEFDSREIRPRLENGGWWRQFGDLSSTAVGPDRPTESPGEATQRRTDATASIRALWNLTDQRPFARAVVTGLFGVDCEHGCKSELHPVYLMAVETNADPSENTWQLFARNWGNQGSCGTLDHQFAAKTLSVVIPAPAGADGQFGWPTDLHYARPTGWSGAPPTISRALKGDGLLVTFAMPVPTLAGLQELSIVINWGTAAPESVPTTPARVANREVVRAAPKQVGEVKTVDEYVAALAANIPDFDSQVAALMPQPRVAANVAADDVISYDVRPYEEHPIDLFPAEPLVERGQPRSVATWIVLCRANNGVLPKLNGREMKDACDKTKWRIE